MTAEVVEWKIGKYKIDDNLWIPLASATISSLLLVV